MAALAPFSAVWWWTHEQAKGAMVRRLGWNAEGYAVLSASGTLAAVAATVATNPLDVLKTRIQCRDEPAAIGTVLRGLLNEAGWGGLYRDFAAPPERGAALGVHGARVRARATLV